MATIVQPYNPWREQLALTALGNTLGGIIGDLWTQHKQNEQNKKANAFRNQLLQDIQSQTQTQNVSAPLLSLGMQNTPDTINPDGWSDTFHKSYNPLPMFDLAANSTSQSNSLPSANDVQRIGSNLAATKRFAMLNPETVHGFISQINQQNEQQRLKDLQAGYADMFRNAGSFDEQLKALALANMFGVGGDKAITPLASWAIHSTPNKTFQQIDAGNNIYGVSFDPKSGQINPSAAFPVGLSPKDELDAKTKMFGYSAVANAKADASLNWNNSPHKSYAEMLVKNNEAIDAKIKELEQERSNADDKNTAEYYNQQIKTLQDQKSQNSAAINAIYSQFMGRTQSHNPSASFNGKTSNGGDYSDIINSNAQKYDLDPDFIAAVIQQESGGHHDAVSNKGAQGLMQLIPETAKRFNVSDPFDPEQNIRGGSEYLAWLKKRYKGNLEKVLWGYYAGEGNADSNKPMPEHIRKYVDSVMAIYRRNQAKRKSQTANTTAPKETQQTAPAQTQAVAPASQSAQKDLPVYTNAEGQIITQSQFKRIVQQSGSEFEAMKNLEARGFFPPELSSTGFQQPLSESSSSSRITADNAQNVKDTSGSKNILPSATAAPNPFSQMMPDYAPTPFQLQQYKAAYSPSPFALMTPDTQIFLPQSRQSEPSNTPLNTAAPSATANPFYWLSSAGNNISPDILPMFSKLEALNPALVNSTENAWNFSQLFGGDTNQTVSHYPFRLEDWINANHAVMRSRGLLPLGLLGYQY